MQVVFSPGAEIKFEGANNFRELGGYRAADGRQVKYGLLYRGGNLDLLGNQIDPCDLFGHRVFHLNTRVHFHEVEFAVFIKEFDRSCADITHPARAVWDCLWHCAGA